MQLLLVFDPIHVRATNNSIGSGDDNDLRFIDRLIGRCTVRVLAQHASRRVAIDLSSNYPLGRPSHLLDVVSLLYLGKFDLISRVNSISFGRIDLAVIQMDENYLSGMRINSKDLIGKSSGLYVNFREFPTHLTHLVGCEAE